MDIVKLRNICREIAKKLSPPREDVVVDGKEKKQERAFTEKELRRIGAHSDLWWADLCEAFGVEE